MSDGGHTDLPPSTPVPAAAVLVEASAAADAKKSEGARAIAGQIVAGEDVAIAPAGGAGVGELANLISEERKHEEVTEGKEEEGKDKNKEEEKVKNVPYGTLFRYAGPNEKLLMFLGTIGAIGVGVSQPIMTIVFGNIVQDLITYMPGITDQTTFQSNIRTGVVYLVLIGAATFVAGYLQMALWMAAGEKQGKRVREEYLKAVLEKDVGWFDATPTGDVTTRLTADMGTLQDGFGEKVGLTIQNVCTFLTGFIIAFIKGWRLALVLCSVFPLLAGAAMIMAKTIGSRQGKNSDTYAEAGAIVQEVLSSIRTVTAFGGQKRDLERYKEKLAEGEKVGIKVGLVNGVSVGVVFGLIFCTYSLGFYYGGLLITYGLMTGGEVINVFFAIIIGAFSLGNCGPNVSAIASAIGAATKIFKTIDEKSPINALSDEGQRLDSVTGMVEFKDINFHYPQRPDVPILKNFSLKVPAGKTVALVGASGSGKSTIVKLLERFYDPASGAVLVDGVDVKSLNVRWLRQQIGFVGQEPVLFDQSVRENLINGLVKPESEYRQIEIDDMIEDACKTANAWDFIQNLPDGVETDVGEAGGMMSGGQKQRIAIARAVMRQPKILLLDEATSALDTESERIVQAALDKAAADRTTIVIAHRLSTIKNADLIVVMANGEIVEQGTHNELIDRKSGAYAALVAAQALRQTTDGTASGITPLSTPVPAASSLVKPPQRKKSDAVAIDVDAHEMTTINVKDEKTGSMRRRRSRSRKSFIEPTEEEKRKKEEAEILKRSFPWKRTWALNRPEWGLFAAGSIASAANGVLMPLFSIIFSSILTVFGYPPERAAERDDGIRFWALMFFIISIGAFLGNFIGIATFTAAGEKLTKRLRERTFEALLKQDISYFDEEKHTTGALTARLAEDAGLVQGLTGRLMSSIIQIGVTMIAGLAIAFSHGWELTLIVLGSVPFIALAGAMQLKVLSGFNAKSKEAYNEANETANEVVDQIRTVLTLTKERKFLDEYRANIEVPHQINVKGAFVGAIGYALSQGMIFWAYALAYYAGAQLIVIGRSTNQNVLTVMFAIIFTAVSGGQAASFAPNYVKAKIAAFSIFDILDSVPKIDLASGNGEVGKGRVGEVVVQDAEFKYPSRPDVPVLNGLSITAAPGQTVALVGPSGCGKSTVIAILERWYDVLAGSASYQGLDVRKWNLPQLRTELALVGQEPILFNLSIRENIQYGARTGSASQEEIERAARMANIHDFVTSLPEGYNTIVGGKGGQLSGGQKQRVAIARALVREPKLLLLDEATSALDSESEKVVQEALDRAAKGRTTIVIAHRLSTIQTADHIFVVNKGKVVEDGQYFDLVAKGGQFAELVAAQSLGKN
ncbi:Multidrug resistance protein 1 [Irineochytrium annulatum]|nr:Multidrug resistance protein 1 [Irineochytrium annulatum]